MRCGVKVAAIRTEPSDDAEQVTQALLDEPLHVTDMDGGWARVETAYGYPGWIRSEALAEGTGFFPAAIGDNPLLLARSFLGAPYEWGGLTRAGIDCSGLVHMAFRLTGKLVSRDAWQQEATGIAIPADSALPGCLVTYGAGKRADHVAFWLGGGRILHSTARDALGVVEEQEPEELLLKRHQFLLLSVDDSLE